MIMKFLVVNSGSTAVKYSLFDEDSLKERKVFSRKEKSFSREEKDFIDRLNPDYVVFRVVHALDKVNTRFIDENTLEDIKLATSFAPLHNTILLELLDYFSLKFKSGKLIAVFDSEFHKSLPAKAYTYPIARDLRDKHKIRKYGFHGLAIESALEELRKTKRTDLPEKIIALHAGGGVSVSAIENAVSVDTSMGLTPTDGIMMLTRSGSVDPELGRVLEEKENLLPSELSKILNFESGFYGMTDSKDSKEIIEKAKKGIEPYFSAYELFLYELKKIIFAYYGVLSGLDVLLLSGGLAYKNEYFADDLYEEIKFLGIKRSDILKVKVNEEALMIKKAKRIINETQ